MINFECQGSGKCCVSNGKNGFVFLTPKDTQRLVDFLGQKRESFAREDDFDWTRFSKTKKRVWHINNPSGFCRFLKLGKCSVYSARPQQCRTWPFYPEQLEPKAWNETARFCPGIGEGRERTKEEIATIVNAQLEADKEY